MIIIKLMGGLGNQLQQYALYKKYELLGKEVYLDTSWFENENQEKMYAPRILELDLIGGVNYKKATQNQIKYFLGNGSTINKLALKIQRTCFNKRKFIVEDKMYYSELLDMDDVYLQGYWACEKYYGDILNTLRQEISFDLSEAIEEAQISNMKAQIEVARSCAIHIRRGDYLDSVNQAIFGNIATEEYYASAYQYIVEKYPETKFFIFSDDIGYVNEKYGSNSNCVIVDINKGLDSRFDIYLMSLCDMHICANSTFSFWGARLSDKHGKEINIRPTIQKNTQVFEPEAMHEQWRGWVFVDPDGNIK